MSQRRAGPTDVRSTALRATHRVMSEDTQETEETLQYPWARATIAGDTITLNPWAPHLARGGPLGMVLERLDGVVLADLFTNGDEEDEELLVRFVSPAPPSDDAIDTLLGWAQTVNYRRVWLPDRVVDLVASGALGTAEVRCPTCRLVWRDRSPEFWAAVHAAGAFPSMCVACGGSLPEWGVVRPDGAGGEAHRLGRRERATAANGPADQPRT